MALVTPVNANNRTLIIYYPWLALNVWLQIPGWMRELDWSGLVIDENRTAEFGSGVYSQSQPLVVLRGSTA